MPAFASQQIVYGRNFTNTILAALKTVPTAALIAAGKIRLNSNPSFNPAPDDTITENAANEANFSGYTAGGIAVVLSAPLNFSTSCQGVVANATFIAATGSPFVPGTVYGYWMDDGTNVILAEKFPPGISFGFSAPGDFLELIGQLPIQLNQLTV